MTPIGRHPSRRHCGPYRSCARSSAARAACRACSSPRCAINTATRRSRPCGAQVAMDEYQGALRPRRTTWLLQPSRWGGRLSPAGLRMPQGLRLPGRFSFAGVGYTRWSSSPRFSGVPRASATTATHMLARPARTAIAQHGQVLGIGRSCSRAGAPTRSVLVHLDVKPTNVLSAADARGSCAPRCLRWVADSARPRCALSRIE